MFRKLKEVWGILLQHSYSQTAARLKGPCYGLVISISKWFNFPLNKNQSEASEPIPPSPCILHGMLRGFTLITKKHDQIPPHHLRDNDAQHAICTILRKPLRIHKYTRSNDSTVGNVRMSRKWVERGVGWLIREGVRKWPKEPAIRYAICGQSLYLFPDGFERRRDSLKSDFCLTRDFWQR